MHCGLVIMTIKKIKTILTVQRETTPVSKQDFSHPARKQTQKESARRFGMVTVDTFAQAQYAYRQSERQVPTGTMFDTVIRKEEMRAETSEDHFETTNMKEFGGSGRPTHFQRLAEHSATMPSAGGPGGAREEKGMGGSGGKYPSNGCCTHFAILFISVLLSMRAAIGERFKQDGDPKSDSAAQRAWAPWGDPGLRALQMKEEGRAPQPREAKEASLQIQVRKRFNK